MKKGILILIVLVILVIGTAAAYFYFKPNPDQQFNGQRPNNWSQRNFQINQSQIDEINSFFDGNPTAEEIQSYCSQNRMSCFYYCRNLNPSSDICKQMIPANRTHGNFSGNFSRNYPRNG